MTEAAGHSLPHLPPASARLGAVVARPRRVAVACIVGLAGLGWLYLGLLSAGMAGAGGVWAALCSSTFGMSASSGAAVALAASMWGAMTLAMMLPSAAPMILTYAEIADTAARQGQRVVSPFVLAAGYLLVWFGFAAVATMAQIALTRVALLQPDMRAASGLLAGVIVMAAGFYQFSALKHACLRQCRAPFQFFFTNWATTPRGVLVLGLRQGLFCVGCCWAMMLVMFAVGLMNAVWMAALGIVMALEKIGTGKRFSHAIGILLIAAGVVFITF